MRRVTQCAPVNSEKYATSWKDNVTENYVRTSNTSVKYYEFGKSIRGCEGVLENDTTPTTTFCVTQYQKDNFLDAYTLLANTAYYNNKSITASDFEPIPDFQVPDADVTLIQLFRKVRYTDRVEDPLFNATNLSSSFKQYFVPSNDLAVLGCTEQYQFCNIGTKKCTQLTGLYEAKHAINNGDLALTPRQDAVYKVMWKAAWTMALQWSTEIYGNNLLLARDWQFTTKSSTSSPLPPNQWQLESWNLHNLSLAVFQRRVNEFAAPEDFEIRPGLSSLKMINQPTDNMREICSQQKVRSSEHHAVSVLGMAIILVVGSVLILLDWVIVQQVFWFRSLTTHHRFAKKNDWINSGTLQLHRHTLESRGIGPWNIKDWEFPVLSKRFEKFATIGTRSDSDIPLGQIVDEGQDVYHSEPYNGGKYSDLPIHTLGTEIEQHHFLSDDKGKASRT
ncbi:uncharacterized protein BDR25DRAFT_224685 [Lindgomyces ingoldianus]|uniref:Uncharacterized protein n=1 Tax=Lindgomyces ingoldianus TaxID=673940 RepID=A0ACB6QV34_9PLEO|nr:uncharacterized protein BDR25DRAFT_224685 [Lindgomyces ingoldianus]KAF2470853.1 hypothetical protein BDR25DRAFT_224685 [Lindgomyces ingoldianus]